MLSRLFNLNTILLLVVVVVLFVALSGLKSTTETNLHQLQQTGQCVVDAVLGGCR